jgi:bifunctional DNA-binding transcriptional regulator/antitoxin component of YhaV-PrlF toxin-antitoxin module
MAKAPPHKVRVLSGGRITDPAQLRRELGLSDGVEVLVFRRGREIVITRSEDLKSTVAFASESDTEISNGSPDDAVHPGST